MMLDVVRKARRLGVPIAPPATHPFNPLLSLRVTHAAPAGEPRNRLIDGLFRAVWGESRDVTDVAEVARIARAAGPDGEATVAAASGDAAETGPRDTNHPAT